MSLGKRFGAAHPRHLQSDVHNLRKALTSVKMLPSGHQGCILAHVACLSVVVPRTATLGPVGCRSRGRHGKGVQLLIARHWLPRQHHPADSHRFSCLGEPNRRSCGRTDYTAGGKASRFRQPARTSGIEQFGTSLHDACLGNSSPVPQSKCPYDSALSSRGVTHQSLAAPSSGQTKGRTNGTRQIH